VGERAAPTLEADPTSTSTYSVEVRRDDGGWSVAIVGLLGRDVGVRTCRDETEAWVYASTVRQHAAWLSSERFRGYYGLPPEA
jgi:hypothetical protein